MKTYRYYVRSPDGRAIFGLDRLEAARAVALEYGPGAGLIDTMAQAYHPMLEEVRSGEGGTMLVYAPIGGWDTGRFGPDRDLIEAIKKGAPAIVHAFLAKGASADAKDANGGSALHWAAARGNEAIVRLLIGHGADVSIRDSTGQTARGVAARKGHNEIDELLAAAGAPAS